MNQSKVKLINELQRKLLPDDVIMLTTIDLRGKPKSRPLQILKIKEPQTLWFFSNEFIGQKNEISENPLVCLSYSNTFTHTYISIIGEAKIANDTHKMEDLWNDKLIKWFPKSLLTPNLALLKISIEEIENWSSID